MNAKSVMLVAVMAALTAAAEIINTAVDPGCEGMGTVTAVGKTIAEGKTQAIKATAAKGYVFAGWYVDGVPAQLAGEGTPGLKLDYRVAANTCVAGNGEEVTYTAAFTTAAEDMLYFDFSNLFSAGFEHQKGGGDYDIDLRELVTSTSFPEIKFDGLAATGLKFDAKTLKLTGKPTKSGDFTITASGKNASGYVFSQIMKTTVCSYDGDRIGGFGEVEFTLGEEVGDYELGAEAFFLWKESDEDLSGAVTISGWANGLSMKNGVVSGIPNKIGTFVLTATAKYKTDAEGNPKTTTETATTIVRILPPELSDYGIELSGLEGRYVGDKIIAEDEDVTIGYYYPDEKTGIQEVKGLPTGLSLEKIDDPEESIGEDGVTNVVRRVRYAVSGTFSKAGSFSVTVKTSYLDDNNALKTITLPADIVVEAVQSYYISATVGVFEDCVTNGCSVAGAAVVQSGAKVALKATADKGSVFAGWYGDVDEVAYADGVDYRNPAMNFTAGTSEGTRTVWRAKFVDSTSDQSVVVYNDGDLDAESDEEAHLYIDVESASLPTVTVKGLPDGYEVGPTGSGIYEISYIPATAKKIPYPGVYKVTVSAVNASKASGETSFTITIGNWKSEGINLADSYGPFTPGEPIDPIDWTGLVDFVAGDKATISTLPKGLTFNKTADAKKKISANTVTGTPTAPGEYTVQVKNEKTKEVATTTFVIAPFPEITVMVDNDARSAGCSVSGAGGYMKGSKVTLKAVAAKGWVFAGWTEPEFDETTSILDILNPTYQISSSAAEDVLYDALFLQLREDYLHIAASGDIVCTLNSELAAPGVLLDLVETGSLPTLTLSGQPAGIKLDAKTGMLSGKATKSGVYYATFSAKNAGGYTFTRVVRFVVLNADGSEPEEAPETDTAGVDLMALEELTTGEYYDPYDIEAGLVAIVPAGDPYESKGDYLDNPVKKITVKGQPAGMSVRTAFDDNTGDGYIYFGGVPNKPGRCTISIDVSYAKGTARTVKTVTVEDGGSMYVDVVGGLFASDEELTDKIGKVSGAGVYAAGATVKLSATPSKDYVFAGWSELTYDTVGEEEVSALAEFALLKEVAGVDYRTTSVSFPLVNAMMPDPIYAPFDSAMDDCSVTIEFDDEVEDEPFNWEIADLGEDASIGFTVKSQSLPKLTVNGLPKKGFSVDAVKGLVIYDSSAAALVEPGVYAVKFSAQNVSKVKAEKTIRIIVPNRTCDAISSNPAVNAYPLTVGTAIGEVFADLGLTEEATADGYTLSVSAPPAGVAFKNGMLTGVPTKAGDYTLTLTAKKTGQPNQIATITVSVAALPAMAVGTFSGGVYEVSDGITNLVGSVVFTASDKGVLSAKVKTIAGEKSLKASAWDSAEEGLLTATLTATAKETLAVELDPELGVFTYQLSGTYFDGMVTYLVLAQRNSFADSEEAKEIAKLLKGTYEFGDVKVSLTDKGVGTLSGKTKTGSVSGTETLRLLAEQDGEREIVYGLIESFKYGLYLRLDFD